MFSFNPLSVYFVAFAEAGFEDAAAISEGVWEQDPVSGWRRGQGSAADDNTQGN